MKMFVGVVMALFICLTFTGYTQQGEPEKLNVAVAVNYLNYTLPNHEEVQMKNRIKNITEQELGKLPNVNIVNIEQVVPKYIINIIASTYDDQFITYVTLFLRRASIPEMYIAPKSFEAYKAWDNLGPNYNLLYKKGIQTGYCTKNKLEEVIKDNVNTFDKQVLELDRILNPAAVRESLQKGLELQRLINEALEGK